MTTKDTAAHSSGSSAGVVSGASASAAGLGAAGAVTAVAVTACCAGPVAGIVGPFLVAALGASGAATFARLQPFAPYLFGFAFLSIVAGFIASYRARSSCRPDVVAAASRRLRFERALLWSAAVVFILSLAASLAATIHL